MSYDETYARVYSEAYAEAFSEAPDDERAKTYAQTYATAWVEANANEKSRLKAILTSPEAKRAPALAEYFAYETHDPAAKVIAVIQTHAVNLPAPDTSSSYEERKRAAGALGLAPIESSAEVTQRAWGQAVTNAHKLHGIEDPEIGASGRKLQ